MAAPVFVAIGVGSVSSSPFYAPGPELNQVLFVPSRSAGLVQVAFSLGSGTTPTFLLHRNVTGDPTAVYSGAGPAAVQLGRFPTPWVTLLVNSIGLAMSYTLLSTNR